MPRRSDPIELTTRWAGYFFVLAAIALLSVAQGQELEGQFTRTVRPFLATYCVGCHGQQRPAAQLDLSGFTTMTALMQDGRRWSQILERVKAEEMPPKGARQPTARNGALPSVGSMRSANMKRAAMPAIQASCWRGASAVPSITTRFAI